VGPSLGGVLVNWQGWRWVFLVNLPIGLAALVAARRPGLLREVRDESRGAMPDLLGIALLTAGVALVALGIVKAEDWGYGAAATLGSVVAGVLLLVALVARSHRHHAPVIEVALFRVRSFAVAVGGVFVFSMGFYALLLCNILFLTQVWHYSVLTAGFAVTPGPLMAAVSSALGGRLSDRFGQRVVALPGGLLFAFGAFLLSEGLGSSPAYAAEFLPATLFTGLGVGLSFAAWSSAAVAQLPPALFATGSAISTCLRQIGAVLGIAILVAVLDGAAVANPLAAFHDAYRLEGIAALLAGGLALALGRVRAGVPEVAPAVEPA
jgi:NTE family protein